MSQTIKLRAALALLACLATHAFAQPIPQTNPVVFEVTPDMLRTDFPVITTTTLPLAAFENQPPKPMRWLAQSVGTADYVVTQPNKGFYEVNPRNQSRGSLPWVTWSDIGREKLSASGYATTQERSRYEKTLKSGMSHGAASFLASRGPKLVGTVYAFAAGDSGSQPVGALELDTDLHRALAFYQLPISLLPESKQPPADGSKAGAEHQLAAYKNTQALLAPLRPQLTALTQAAAGKPIQLFSNMPDDDPFIASAQPVPAPLKRQIMAQINAVRKTKSCDLSAYPLDAQQSRSVYAAHCIYGDGSYPGDGLAVFELNAAGKPVVVRFARRLPANESPTGKATTIAQPMSSFILGVNGMPGNEYQAFRGVLDLNPANKGKADVLAQVVIDETSHHESAFGPTVYSPSAKPGGLWQARILRTVSQYQD